MNVLFAWWLLAEVLGIAVLPLCSLVFANLPDRGWGLARPFGLLVLGWLVWFPLSLLHALPYSRAWIAGTLLALVLANGALLARPTIRASLRALLVRQWGYLLLAEGVFAGALALMGWLRSFTPAVVDQEKFMDVAFLSSIWRTPHLPPPDPWLAGQPINYYYFGHFLLATMAKLLGTPPAVAFNAGVALVFALTASAIFAVATNLVALAHRAGAHAPRALARAAPFGIVSALLVLVAGNLNGAREWWQTAVAQVGTAPGSLSSPWAWWLHPALWLQYNWWNPSRVVPNTINEFPAFSFVLSDLHAHVLALPFAVLALGVACNLLLARGDGLRAFGLRGSGITALVCSALVLGALYAINGWDLPTYLGLAVLALGIQQWLGHGRRWTRLFTLDLVTAVLLLVALSVLLFVPFYQGYTSPAEGVGSVIARGGYAPIGDVVAIFGLPLYIAGSLLLVRLVGWLGMRIAPAPHLRWGEGAAYLPANVATGRLLAGILVGGGAAVLLLWTAMAPGFARWTLVWSLLLLAGCAALVLRRLRSRAAPSTSPGDTQREMAAEQEPATASGELAETLVWCLVGTSAALLAICELVYLRDLFDGGADYRMNTVFKFYYQVWLLLGVVSGPLLACLWRDGRAWVASMLAPAATAARAEPAVALPLMATVRRAPHTPGGAGTLGTPGATLALASGPAGGDPHANARAMGGGPNARRGIEEGADGLTIYPGERPAPGADAYAASDTAGQRWLRVGGLLCWAAVLLALLAAVAVYPVQAAASRTANFSLPRSLDGTAYMATDPLNAGDAAAIAWLNDPAHVTGDPVIVEASGGEYSHYDRVSAFTGLPTILGWSGHEWQWRVTWLLQPQHAGELDRRQADINTIYTSSDAALVRTVLARYHVRYVYVGAAERAAYPGTNLDRFSVYLHVVYHAQNVTIYSVP